MRHGKPSDYAAPFKDGPHWRWSEPSPLWDAERDRCIAIGRAALLAWWGRVKNDTSPGTYGQTDHDFTSGVAFYLAHGGPCETIRQRAQPNRPDGAKTDYCTRAAIEAYDALAA